MSFEKELQSELQKFNVDFFCFADIYHLSKEQNRGYPLAILIGILLSAEYLHKITTMPDYVEEMKRNNLKAEDEFDQKEKLTDHIADEVAAFITSKGYSAFSQSEANLYKIGSYDEKNHRTPLPHKTIALLTDMGWIGKHDLLITHEFGSSLVICSILTDAPIGALKLVPQDPKCGSCSICKDVCPTKAITGKNWSINTPREEIVDVYNCTMCLKCLAFCPWTLAYMKKNLKT